MGFNLLHKAAATAIQSESLSTVVFDGRREIPLEVFTLEGDEALLHYAGDYFHCTVVGCPACAAGIEVTSKFLLPVVDCHSGIIRVLTMSTRNTPQALFPQMSIVLKAFQDTNTRQLAFVKRLEGNDFAVTSRALAEAEDENTAVIEAFLTEEKTTPHKLCSVFATLTNDQIKAIPEIARTLKLKGVKL